MLKNIFANKKVLDRSWNIHIDEAGLDGERLSASALTLALNARISWASRKEDNSKVDLIVTMLHPWENNHVEVILAQVKSGSSFGETITDNRQAFKIVKAKFYDYLMRNHPTLLCWVDSRSNEVFWFIVKSNSRYIRTVYGHSHKLCPATRFDVVRLMNSFSSTDGGKGLIFHGESNNSLNFRYPYDELKKTRAKARQAYNSFKSETIISPLFGSIEITNFGWRHMTRASRWNEYKVASYEIIPILDKILKRSPSKHFIQNQNEEISDSKTYRRVEYILEYHRIKLHVAENDSLREAPVFIKLIEVLESPTDWKNETHLTTKIRRRVYFKSIYYK